MKRRNGDKDLGSIGPVKGDKQNFALSRIGSPGLPGLVPSDISPTKKEGRLTWVNSKEREESSAWWYNSNTS